LAQHVLFEPGVDTLPTSRIALGDRPSRNTHLLMRTLLRNPSSGHYFAALGKWTLDRDEAHDFGPVRRAVRFACKAGFADMDLVLSFDNAAGVAALPFKQICLIGNQ